MEIDRKMEKQYTLLVEGLSLEEKSWLYNQAKKEGSNQSKVVLSLIKKSMESVQ